MRPKTKRLLYLLAGLASLGLGAGIILYVFQQNLVFFLSPSDIVQQKPATETRIRVGGLVEMGSLRHDAADSLSISFTVTDLRHSLPVRYRGILPALFREGQGVVAEGKLAADGTFAADVLLAKHDENYMPPEVADALKKSGRWQHYNTQDILKEPGTQNNDSIP